MEKLNVDLGKSYGQAIPSVKEMKDEVMYPSFHVEGEEDLDLPYEGTMLVKFCKTSSTHRVDEDGKEHYECTVQVKKIISVEADEEEYKAPAKSHAKESDDALDELASKIKHKMEKEY